MQSASLANTLTEASPESLAQPSRENRPLGSTLQLVALLGLTLLSRLPFLSAGYGNDADGWRVIRAAHQMAGTGQGYFPSRLPGYPLVEGAALFLHKFLILTPVVFNLCTTVMCVAAVFFLLRILQASNQPHPHLWALSFAFVPVVYIESVGALDLLWSTAFVLAATLYALRRSPGLAGLLLGLAVGCRITAVLFALPIGLLLVTSPKRSIARSLCDLAKCGAATALVSCVCFYPVFAAYGLGFLTYIPTTLEYKWVFESATSGVWGCVWPLLILAFLGSYAIREFTGQGPGKTTHAFDRIHRIWIIAYLCGIAPFVRLPIEQGYLLVSVPFFVLMFSRLAPKPIAVSVCALLIVSPFLPRELKASASLADSYLLADYRGREQRVALVKCIIEKARALPAASYIITGTWGVYAEVMVEGDLSGLPKLMYSEAGIRHSGDGTPEIYVVNNDDRINCLSKKPA